MSADLFLAVRFWAALFLVGAAAFPISRILFGHWWDEGYLLAKAVGLCISTYVVYLLASLRIMPFSIWSIAASLIFVFLLGAVLSRVGSVKREKETSARKRIRWTHVLIAEAVTLAALSFWTWIKAHEPSIQALEKFMDYGFTKAVLNSAYFPPPDMWLAGETVNYYYFGHVVMAFLTRLSGLPLSVTFNLMLASLFALTFTMSFTIGAEVYRRLASKSGEPHDPSIERRTVVAGLLVGFLTTLSGNMQTIYAFTKGYTGEDVQPFWKLFWGAGEFWHKLPEGLQTYWYANATRFIPFTIHEFPGYSFVVSDVHGHVLSLPFALLAIAMLLTLFGFVRGGKQVTPRDTVSYYFPYAFYGLLTAVLFMTNALDGPIYAGLFSVLLLMDPSAFDRFTVDWAVEKAYRFVGLMAAGPAILPFVMNFKSFVSSIAVNCPLPAMANSTFGLFMFESVEKCQRSPFWMLYLLWGFFWITGLWFIVGKIRFRKDKLPYVSIQGTQTDRVLSVFFVYSVLLVLFAEFFYFKDIYPAHFRSNTMFKLGYQAFIMFSIIAGVTIVMTLRRGKAYIASGLPQGWWRRLFVFILIPHLFLVSIFPVFAVRSYFNGLKYYEGIDGLRWLSAQYPDDYNAIVWLNREIEAGRSAGNYGIPVIAEADGDSYTNYARVSAFTGLPTIIGWPVHEWLWRGTYDVVAPRREDVMRIYEEADIEYTKKLLSRYKVSYIMVGTLEREKYDQLNEPKFLEIGDVVYRSGNTSVYRIR